MMTTVLKVANVTKVYEKRAVVDDLSFSIGKGEIIGLVGPNGAGKTTLMRILVGLIINYDGEVFVKRSRGKKTIGCMIEAPSFYPSLSGYENLRYFAEVSGGFDKHNVEEIIDFLGLRSFVNKKVKQYSLGMRQRLGIAQALLNHPDLLILDEPTNGLDPSGVFEMRETIKKIVKHNCISVLISSHILSEIEAICDRVLLLQKGKLVKSIDLKAEAKHLEVIQLVIHSADSGRLIEFLQSLPAVKILEANDQLVKVLYRADEVESLIRTLVFQQIRFHEIYEQRDSLEKQFFDILGGNRIE